MSGRRRTGSTRPGAARTKGDDQERRERLVQLLAHVKSDAREYYRITGRPLGVTGEIAEYEAARLLRVKLAPVRQHGYDATRRTREGVQRLQIKGRCLLADAKPGQRLGGISLAKEWDAVLLVLLDESFEATAIYEADRAAITKALTAPGSRARNERGQLGVANFRRIGRQVWPSPGG